MKDSDKQINGLLESLVLAVYNDVCGLSYLATEEGFEIVAPHNVLYCIECLDPQRFVFRPLQLCQQHKVGEECPNMTLLIVSLKDVFGEVRIENAKRQYDTFLLYA